MRRAAGIVMAMAVAIGVDVRTAAADWSNQAIPIPLLGTSGPSSAYPSTLTVVNRAGQGKGSWINVVLHHVTHPCPEELAVLLVHNDVDAFLLMSNAGGCRPLRHTNIRFSHVATSSIPDEQPAAPAYGGTVFTLGANYGTVPDFPAPAPPGPYTLGLPPDDTDPGGTWRLYVLDTTAGNRGVIAAGWSLQYNTEPAYPGVTTHIDVPGSGTMGEAALYPLQFNLTRIPEGVPVNYVRCAITLHHARPDDLRVVLQSPSGTSVVLMANAGGNTAIAAGTTITFASNTSNVLPDSTPIAQGTYLPGAAYGASVALAAPAPQPPYATVFSAFQGEAARGFWSLWVYDDALFNVGEIESASLIVGLERDPGFTVIAPTTETSFTANQPFVRIVASMPTLESPHSLTWRDGTSGEVYAAGAFTNIGGTTEWFADIPVRHGTNAVEFTTTSTRGSGTVYAVLIDVDEFTYSLAEGATGGFFDLDVTLANPASADAPVTIDFLPEGGAPIAHADTVAANAPLPLHVDGLVPDTAVSTVVHSTDAIPLAVERTMIWDASGYGGHGGTAVRPDTRWLFAEGSQGFFDTYVLLANDNAVDVDVDVTFLLEGGGVTPHSVTVPAKSRRTLWAGDVPALIDTSFGIDISAPRPIIAERSMYLPGTRLFEGGHESAGVNATSTDWFLAEGATGPFFDCFVLLSNPNPTAATVALSYLLPDGTTVPQQVVMPANGRITINVETVAPELANAAVSTIVHADVGIVAERAMYWPSAAEGWREAHNSFGITTTATRWGLADGRIGGPRAFATYVLLANPNPLPAEVELRFLRAGAAPVVRTYILPPTSRRNVWVNDEVPELGPGTFSVDVQVLNAQPIAVEKALYWNADDGTVWAGGTNVTATRLPPP